MVFVVMDRLAVATLARYVFQNQSAPTPRSPEICPVNELLLARKVNQKALAVQHGVKRESILQSFLRQHKEAQMDRPASETGMQAVNDTGRPTVGERYTIEARYRELDELYDMYDFALIDNLLKRHSTLKKD